MLNDAMGPMDMNVDRINIGMILGLIPVSLCLILGRLLVFNIVKSSVLGFIRTQGHL